MIFLFTDFGAADLYVGQLKAVLAQAAPSAAVIDLLNDAPRFHVEAAAHLLAALARALPADSITLAVVDPGVGTERRPVVVRCARRWFVGPDNGLLSVLAGREPDTQCWEIVWRPETLSRSFHGRDLFAPVAGRLAAGGLGAAEIQPTPGLDARLPSTDLPAIVYIDHYGNAMTGIRAASISTAAAIEIGGTTVAHAGIFAEAEAGRPFWYCNSIGLVELACNRASAAHALAIAVGDPVRVRAPAARAAD